MTIREDRSHPAAACVTWLSIDLLLWAGIVLMARGAYGRIAAMLPDAANWALVILSAMAAVGMYAAGVLILAAIIRCVRWMSWVIR